MAGGLCVLGASTGRSFSRPDPTQARPCGGGLVVGAGRWGGVVGIDRKSVV